jgi:hypothetical protein
MSGPAVGTANSHGWAVRQLNLLIPTMEEIRDHRPILPALVVGWLFTITAAFAIRPIVWSAFSGEQAQLGQAVSTWMWVVALFAPAAFLVKALLLTGITWSVAVLMGQAPRVLRLFSVFLYGEAILAVQGVLVVLFLHMRGLDRLREPADLSVPMGIDALIRPESPVLMAIAQNMSAIHVVWFAFVAVALRRAVCLERPQAVGAAVFAWGCIALFAAARAALAL